MEKGAIYRDKGKIKTEYASGVISIEAFEKIIDGFSSNYVENSPKWWSDLAMSICKKAKRESRNMDAENLLRLFCSAWEQSGYVSILKEYYLTGNNRTKSAVKIGAEDGISMTERGVYRHLREERSYFSSFLRLLKFLLSGNTVLSQGKLGEIFIQNKNIKAPTFFNMLYSLGYEIEIKKAVSA
jgi:hypothetical protein